MSIPKSSAPHLAVALLALVFSGIAAAQTYPSKPVRVVIPFPPGGAIDWTARVVATKMGEQMNAQFIIDNRPGAGGSIAAELVSKAPPDGYTLMQGTASNAITTALNPKAPDFGKEFAPVVLLGSSIFILVAHPSVPVKTVKELIAFAKARPGQLEFASAGNGTTNHLTMELFKSMAGIDIVHVPYKGGAPAMLDQIAGRVALGFSNTTVSTPHIKSGRLVALGTSGSKRSAVVPDIPTVAQAGVKGFDAITWYGLVAPAGTPAPVIDRLNAEANRALKLPDVREKFAADGIDVGGGTPQEFGTLIRTDIAKWSRVIKAAGIKPE
ncbi:MAG: tripartite tricarboxylate transporter substrate binding protein [Burkholderiales bacterium]